MSTQEEQAKSSIANLLESNEDQLYEELGMRAKAQAQDTAKGGTFEPLITYDAKQMGALDEIRKFGWRLFNRWLVEAHKLLCGSDPADKEERQKVAKAFAVDETTVGAAVAALLISQLGLAAALAAVVAAILVKRFFYPTYELFCESLRENLPRD